MHLRPRLDAEGARFAILSQGLQGGGVITQFSFPAQEVLLLKDGQPHAPAVLRAQGTGSDPGAHSWVPPLPTPSPSPPLSPNQSLLQIFWKGNKATGTRNLTGGIPFALSEICMKIIME